LNPDASARLSELLRELRRHQEAIREYSLAGYASMVEKHRASLAKAESQVRCHCAKNDLELPPELSES
jgi:hypothetical protein